jgi:hypothetical protein
MGLLPGFEKAGLSSTVAAATRRCCCIYFSKTIITLPHYLAALLPRKSAVVANVMPPLAFFERIRWEALTAGAVIAITG